MSLNETVTKGLKENTFGSWKKGDPHSILVDNLTTLLTEVARNI